MLLGAEGREVNEIGIRVMTAGSRRGTGDEGRGCWEHCLQGAGWAGEHMKYRVQVYDTCFQSCSAPHQITKTLEFRAAVQRLHRMSSIPAQCRVS